MREEPYNPGKRGGFPQIAAEVVEALRLNCGNTSGRE
jgi:hypothetical protein